MASPFTDRKRSPSLGGAPPKPQKRKERAAVVNRKRSKPLNVRMTEDELKHFRERYIKSEMNSQVDFILRAVDNVPIIIIQELTPLLVELKKQGINLNQAVRNINEGTPLFGEIEQCIDRCNKTYEELYKVLRKIRR